MRQLPEDTPSTDARETETMSRTITMLAALALLLAGAGRVQAGQAYNFSSSHTDIFGGDVSVGFSFTPNQAISVTALDIWVTSLPSGTSSVRLYDGMGNVLASATVSTSDPTEGSPQSFYSHAITPVSLISGTTYYIAADIPFGTNGTPTPDSPATGLTVNPLITFGLGVSEIQTGQNPTVDNLIGPSASDRYLAPNFDIAVSSVPEPASLTLLGIGAFGMMGYAWRRRRLAMV
jgi:hypothetical protein